MPPQPLKQLTAKHCYAMQEAFKAGLGIPLWADYVLSMAPDGRIQHLRSTPTSDTTAYKREGMGAGVKERERRSLNAAVWRHA